MSTIKITLPESIEAPYEREVIRLQEEVERLKGLLKKYYCSQWHPDDEHLIEDRWRGFKLKNNL